MKKYGFTLIELLAVIIILGILMLVAIPSVTNYINNSRKDSYIDTAKQYIKGATNLVNSGNLDVFDPSVTYYIPSTCIPLETGGESPYGGKFNPAYIIVTYDNNSYNYYWMSRDNNDIGIKKPVASIKLDTKQIETGIKIDDLLPKIGIDDRETIVVFNNDCSSAEAPTQADDIIAGEEGLGSDGVVIYPTGKTKSTVVVGDLVTIGTEEFYVVKHEGKNLVLLSHYNLNVGSRKWSGAPEGIQSSSVKGWIYRGTKFGILGFSSTNYWDGKVGTDYPGDYCRTNTYTEGTTCVYVYDSNSDVKVYVDEYKAYLERQGAKIKEARLLKVEEAFELGCGNGAWNCNNAPSWVYETTYWLGSAGYNRGMWTIVTNGYFDTRLYYGDGRDYGYGLRPVIVI